MTWWEGVAVGLVAGAVVGAFGVNLAIAVYLAREQW